MSIFANGIPFVEVADNVTSIPFARRLFLSGNVTVTKGTDGSANIAISGGGGGGALEVQDDGFQIVAAATVMNFTGDGVGVSDIGGVATVEIAGFTGTRITLDGGGPIGSATLFDFETSGLTVADNGAGSFTLGAVFNFLAVADEGAPIVDAIAMEFVGAGVTASNGGAGLAVVTVPGESFSSLDVEDDGVPIVSATITNFTGAGVTVTDVGGIATIDIPAGGSSASFFTGFGKLSDAGLSSSGNATKGVIFTPSANMAITGVIAGLQPTGLGNDYSCLIAELSDATDAATVISVLGTTETLNPISTLPHIQAFDFVASVNLVSGTPYLVALQRTDGVGTTACRSRLSNYVYFNAPGSSPVISMLYNTIGVSAAQAPTATSTTQMFIMGLRGSF